MKPFPFVRQSASIVLGTAALWGALACSSKSTSHGSTGSGGSGTGGSSSGGAATTATGGRAGASGTLATGGSPGTGGVPATGGAPGTGGATPASNSVLERNNHPSRDGLFIQPTLTRTTAATLAKDTGFAASFTGSTWASALYLENGPNGKGAFFAVTNDDNVFALDETTGATIWQQSIGTAASRTGQSCGDITPIGIISTPVIDAASRTIYVAGAIGNTTAITAHQVHALSVDDGSERTGWPVDVSTIPATGATFTASSQNQRTALSLVGGVLYVGYGGHNGDCGNYRGWVFAINTADPTKTGAWVTGGTRGEAIWAAGGMASDGKGIFAVTGNNLTGTSTHADSEEVVRLTGLAALDRTNANLFYPTTWKMMDSTDADFGASSPVYLTSPAPMVVAVTKDGHLFVLDATNLGGMGGQLAQLTVASGGTMIVHTAPAAYTDAQGAHVILTTNSGGQCPTGGASGKVVMSVLIPPGSPPQPTVSWCVATSNGSLGFPAAPMVTTTDGQSQPIVWFMNGTKLMGVDGATGATIYGGGGAGDACTGVHKWVAPIAVKGRIVVSGDTHLCSWSAH